jgi:hypothetical protein
VDVITVHRMLKNSVPIREYALMTEKVARELGPGLDDRLERCDDELEGLGRTSLFYADITRHGIDDDPPPSAQRKWWRHITFTFQAMLYLLRLKSPHDRIPAAEALPAGAAAQKKSESGED